MATKIRLQRRGRKSYAFYSIVIADVRAPRDGKFTEKIGTYNPNTNPATVDLKFDRALYWVEAGAQPTDTVRNILSNEGVYLMKHLRGGVKKGAFDEATAQAKFEAWKSDKQKGIEAFEAKKAADAKAAAAARLDAEKKINEEIAKKIDKAVFPGSQGGPLMHIIAAKAVAFGEALQPEFKTYIDQVVENSSAMGEGMVDGGLRLVSGGTDNHLCLVDLTPADITGKDAEKVLESVGLTVNKNTIPNETRSPFVTSGIRVGSAAATTRGFNKDEFTRIGQLIAASVYSANDEARLKEIAAEVSEMLAKHPLYPSF